MTRYKPLMILLQLIILLNTDIFRRALGPCKKFVMELFVKTVHG